MIRLQSGPRTTTRFILLPRINMSAIIITVTVISVALNQNFYYCAAANNVPVVVDPQRSASPRVGYAINGIPEETLKYFMNRSGKLYTSVGNNGANTLVNSDGDNGWQSSEDSNNVKFPQDSYSSDLATAADGYSGSVGWSDDKGAYGIHTTGKNPLKAYGYLKGWSAQPHTFGHHHSGHHHLGWPSFPPHHHDYGWGGYGNGWNNGHGLSGIFDIGHHWWDTVASWFGPKATVAGAAVLAIFKYVIIAVPIAAIIILIILFLPIPAIVTPGICSRSASTSRIMAETGRLAQTILTSDECIERISCQLARAARTADRFSIVDTVVSSIPKTSTWIDRAVDSIKLAHNGTAVDACGRFACDPVGQLRISLRQYQQQQPTS